MRYEWEPIGDEHNALLIENDKREKPLKDHVVLAARRDDGSLAGWGCIKQPGPMLAMASKSPIVAIRLIEHLDAFARSIGLRAYGICTRRKSLSELIKRLPGVSYVEYAGRMYWFIRGLA